MLTHGGIPKVAPAVRPPPDFFRWWLFGLFLPQRGRGPPAEKGIVNGIGIRLDVTAKVAKHLGYRGTGVLGLVLEKDMLGLGEGD
jgi:hypothetical protein